MMFPCLGVVLASLGVLTYYRTKSTRDQKEIFDNFWDRENSSNATRRKDISSLPYITIPLDSFPIGSYSNPELLECEEKLSLLSTKKILNLTGISNTDLKIQYGPANLDNLSDADYNCTQLLYTLQRYGKLLFEQGDTTNAITVLEFAIACHTDVSETFLLLAQLYSNQSNTAKIASLIKATDKVDDFRRPTLVEKLDKLLHPAIL